MVRIEALPADANALDLARLAAPLQASPGRFQAYFGAEEAEIADELDEIPEWREHTVVAVDDAGRLIGWLAAEHDDEIGRVWWWGPVVSDDHGWSDVAGLLLDSAERGPAGRFSQFEFAVGSEHLDAIALAERRGYRRDIGSVLLHLDLDEQHPTRSASGVEVVPVGDHTAVAVVELHEALFPGSHLTGQQVVDSADRDAVLVALDGVSVVGYLRAEIQPGGEGYIDFVGTAPTQRSRGVGGDLVAAAVDLLAERGASAVSLTVREDNAPARALYRRLGFDGTRILVPLRLGFRP